MKYEVQAPVEINNKMRFPGDIVDASEFRAAFQNEGDLEATPGEAESLLKTGHIKEVTV